MNHSLINAIQQQKRRLKLPETVHGCFGSEHEEWRGCKEEGPSNADVALIQLRSECLEAFRRRPLTILQKW